MLIHQNFKDHLKELRPDIQERFWLKEIDSIPNEDILKKMDIMFNDTAFTDDESLSWDERLRNHSMLTEDWSTVSILMAFDPNEIKAICETFIRTKSWTLIRRAGIATLINTKGMVEQFNEEEKFVTNKVVRVCSAAKMRWAGFLQAWRDDVLKQYIWRHFKVLWYNKEWFSIDDDKLNKAISPYQGNVRHKKVYLEDAYWNVYILPQAILIPTSIKNLKEHETAEMLEKIKDQLKDSAKYDIDRLSNDYQWKLREFMNASALLEEKLSGNIDEEAKRILDMQLNMKGVIEKNEQITMCEYIPWRQLIVETVPLWNSWQPIGRYRIEFELWQRHVRVFNIDINNKQKIQHPHINRWWEPCLSDWTNPMRESFNQKDYITLVSSFVSYLESLNERSVFMSMSDFQTDYRKLFAYQIKNKPDKLIEESHIVEEDVIEAPTQRFIEWNVVVVQNGDIDWWHPTWTMWIIVEVGVDSYRVRNEYWEVRSQSDANLELAHPRYVDGQTVIINVNENEIPSGTVWIIEDTIWPTEGSLQFSYKIRVLDNRTYRYSESVLSLP